MKKAKTKFLHFIVWAGLVLTMGCLHTAVLVAVSNSTASPLGNDPEIVEIRSKLKGKSLISLLDELETKKNQQEKRAFLKELSDRKPETEEDVKRLLKEVKKADLSYLIESQKGRHKTDQETTAEAALRAIKNVGKDQKHLSKVFAELLKERHSVIRHVIILQCAKSEVKEAVPELIKIMKGYSRRNFFSILS